MAYLQRGKVRPNPDELTPAEVRYMQQHFEPYTTKLVVDGDTLIWNEIEEIEVVAAPRASGPAGWIVRNLIHGDERYHVGIYFGRNEAVLPNVTLNVARYIVESIAYFAPLPIRFKGPDGLVPVTER